MVYLASLVPPVSATYGVDIYYSLTSTKRGIDDNQNVMGGNSEDIRFEAQDEVEMRLQDRRKNVEAASDASANSSS